MNRPQLPQGRTVEREQQVRRIEEIAQASGATAFHLFGSLGRGDADELSDIDAWVTYPDDRIAQAIADRRRLFADVGDVLIVHEMAPNRPVGGMYSLVLYQTAAGPMQIDWYLCPQRSSRIDRETCSVFVDAPVPIGDRVFDSEADHHESLGERVTWLICMAFIAIKMISRQRDDGFLSFLGDRYVEIGSVYELDGILVTSQESYEAVETMLRQLLPYADAAQKRAIRSICEWIQTLSGE